MSQTNENLANLAQSIAQSHYTKSYVEKNREQSARQLEEQVRTSLNQIVNEILMESTSDISLIQHKFATDVEHLIRAAVSNAYSIGINYVGETKKRPHLMFLTETDIKNIKGLTGDFNHTFWRRVSAVLHQKDTIQTKNARFSPRSKLSLSNLISSLAVKIVTKSIASGTVSKINQLSKIPNDIKLEADTKSANIMSAQFVDVFVWHTMNDERVCPLCSSLDGMEWSYNDPNMLVPPDDSHDNCRCSLNIKPITDETE